MSQSVVVSAVSIREYFQDAVEVALGEQGLSPDRATSSYVVDLLCDFARAQELALDRALAVVMAEARQVPPGESVARFKQVGDHSLYIAGYFSESLRRSELDQGYYIRLGGEAYRTASVTLRRMGSGSQLVVVFAELGEEFPRFVDVLDEVRCQGSQLDDLGELYEQWLRTRSEAIARRLRAAGVLLGRGELE